jgi:hypothetical protein
MLAEFWLYIRSLLSNWFTWFAVLTAIPEAASWLMTKALAEKVAARLDQWVSPETRQRSWRILSVMGLMFAGFVAWDEQYRVAQKQWSHHLR